jgi:hypothetical protein
MQPLLGNDRNKSKPTRAITEQWFPQTSLCLRKQEDIRVRSGVFCAVRADSVCIYSQLPSVPEAFSSSHDLKTRHAVVTRGSMKRDTVESDEFCGCIRFEVFTVVTMKNGVFWDVTLCGFYKNKRFEELSASIIRVTRISELGTTLTSYG